jgi:type II secretion system protein L
MSTDRNWNALRLLDGRLAWYRPDSDGEPVWLDDDDRRARLLETVQSGQSPVCFAAPATNVRLQRVQISAEEKKHLAKSLPYMLEEQLAQDVDTLHFATREIAPLDYGVAICELSRMEDWQAMLSELPVTLWLPEPLLLPWREGEWCLLLEQGQALLRTGACDGAGLERELTGALLQSALAAGDEPSALIVYGEDQQSDTALVPESLRDRVQWRRGNLGSALLLAEDLDQGLNLLQGSFAPRLPLAQWWQEWRRVAVLFGAAVALHLLATWADYAQLDRQNLALRGAIESSYRQANPRGAVVDPEKQLSRQLNDLRGGGQSSGFVSLVAQVGEVLAANPGTSIASLNYSQRAGEMRLNILAADYGAVEKIREAIGATGLEATMENSNAQGDGVRARLRVAERS